MKYLSILLVSATATFLLTSCQISETHTSSASNQGQGDSQPGGDSGCKLICDDLEGGQVSVTTVCDGVEASVAEVAEILTPGACIFEEG